VSIDKEEMSADKKTLLPPVYLFISIIMIGILSILLPIKTVASPPFNLIGLVPFLFGVIINFVSSKAFMIRIGTAIFGERNGRWH